MVQIHERKHKMTTYEIVDLLVDRIEKLAVERGMPPTEKVASNPVVPEPPVAPPAGRKTMPACEALNRWVVEVRKSPSCCPVTTERGSQIWWLSKPDGTQKSLTLEMIEAALKEALE
jgi:hypothetical protein